MNEPGLPLEPREWRALIIWALARYGGHPDWDELFQGAQVAAWQAVQAHPETSATTIIVKAARWSALHHFRQVLGPGPEPRWVFIEDERRRDIARWGDQEGDVHLRSGAFEPQEDLWPAVLERLEGEEVWQWLRPQLTEPERQVIQLWIWEELTPAEIAVELGIPLSRVGQLAKSGLDRYSRHADLPPSPGRKGALPGAGRQRVRKAWRSREENRVYMVAYRARCKR